MAGVRKKKTAKKGQRKLRGRGAVQPGYSRLPSAPVCVRHCMGVCVNASINLFRRLQVSHTRASYLVKSQVGTASNTDLDRKAYLKKIIDMLPPVPALQSWHQYGYSDNR